MGKRKTINYREMSRAKFRSTPEWKDHRALMLERDEYTCQCCGARHTEATSSSLQVHHMILDKAKYTDLTHENFIVLCPICHRFIHQMHNKLHGKRKGFMDLVLVELVNKFFK